MTEVATGETPAETVPPVPPAPELAAEAETSPSEAAAPVETPDQAAPDGEARAPELAYQNGSTSAAILDHFADSAEGGNQTIAQVIAGLGGTVSRNTIESAVRRLHEAGRLLRTAPGTYRLAPPRPPEPAKPAAQPEPVRGDEMSDQQWFDALEAWFADPHGAVWDTGRFGPPPDVQPNRIPPHVALRMTDRLRKREQRRKDAEAAVARQVAADRQLRERLIAGCFGNFMPGPAIDDLTVVRAMLRDGVPMENILIGLKRTVDRRIDPRAAPISTWRDERFLRAVARCALLEGLLPRMVDAWSAVGTVPASAADASKASPGTPGPAALQTALAPSPQQRDASHGDDAAELGPMAAALMRKFGQADGAPSPEVPAAAPAVPPPDDRSVAAGRAEILAAFARNRTPPQPAPPQPRPAARQAEPASMSEAGLDEIVAGWVAGNLEWPRRMLGPAPGESGCRVPLSVLKRNRLA